MAGRRIAIIVAAGAGLVVPWLAVASSPAGAAAACCPVIAPTLIELTSKKLLYRNYLPGEPRSGAGAGRSRRASGADSSPRSSLP